MLLDPAQSPAIVDGAIEKAIAKRVAERERAQRSGQLEEIRERCSTLKGFITEAWPILEPAQPFKWGWALDCMAEHLEAVSDGQIKRLLMNVPPGMMKSLMSGAFWPAFEWGPLARPGLRIVGASFKNDHASRDSARMKALVMSDWYRDLFPHVQTKGGSDWKWANSATGWRKGVSIPGLTGDRGDRVIIDDPHSVEGGESEIVRNKTLRMIRETVPTRLNDPDKSAIMIIMQRVHQNDVSGMIVAENLGYEHLMLPMRFESERKCYTVLGLADPRQYDGELLFPERFTPESVERTEKEMTAYAVAGQMQQRPVPRDGALFKRGWFEVVPARPSGGKGIRAWDLAATEPKPGTRPDWTVGIKVTRVGGVFYVEGMVRVQMTPGKVEQLMLATASQDQKSCRIRITQDPGQAGKAQALNLIRMLAGYIAYSRPATGDKATRAAAAAAQAEFGNIKLVAPPNEKGQTPAWVEVFLDEVCNFPSATHDDIVDAFADAINELALGGRYSLDNID